MKDWIDRLFADPDFLRMGHAQRAADGNLGLGWIYYGLARVVRPKTVVVIGSWRGFVPLVFGKALLDNGEGGEVIFVDPSMVDDCWKDPAAVTARFARLGVGNVRHYLMTTQQFVETPEYRAIEEVGILFVDGYHTLEQVRFDHEAFKDRIPAHGLALFHDTQISGKGNLYGPDRAYDRQVAAYLATLRREGAYEVLDLPFASGVALVRHP